MPAIYCPPAGAGAAEPASDPARVASSPALWHNRLGMHEHAPVLYNTPRKLRPFLELATRRGLDLSPLLAAHDTSLAAMSHPDTRLPRAQLVAIMRELLARLNDPLAGLHAAEHFELEDLDLLGYLAQQCATPLQALEALVGYAPLINDASRASLSRDGGEVALSQWLDGDPAQLPELTDYMMASSHMGVCRLAGTRISALRVELARAKPASPEHARGYRQFFGGPVAFGVARSRIVYAQAALSQPLAHGDRRLALLLHRQAEARLARSQRPANLREQVTQRLLEQVRAGRPDPDALARSLRMSARTLRRRLLAIGCSYRELLDEVRHREALQLMHKGELAVGEAAQRLGFEDASAFARAFRRWTGLSPSSWKHRDA